MRICDLFDTSINKGCEEKTNRLEKGHNKLETSKKSKKSRISSSEIITDHNKDFLKGSGPTACCGLW